MIGATIVAWSGPLQSGSFRLGRMSIEHAGFSIRGSKRPTNDDRLYVSEKFGLIAIADGIGGSTTGGQAAQDCVDLMREYLANVGPIANRVEVLRDAIVWTNGRMFARSWTPGRVERNQGGCCFAGVLLDEHESEFTTFHVGDSAVYEQTRQGWRKLTADHMESVARPTPAGGRSRKPRITRAMGVAPAPKVDFATFPMTPGRRLLITSDGCDLKFLSDVGVPAPSPDAGRSLEESARDLATAVTCGPMLDDSSAIMFQADN